jgi:hypothetical protein
VGGVARFQTLCNEYAKHERYAGQPELLTLFSGDAFNPSLESSVTKGMDFFWMFVIAGFKAVCLQDTCHSTFSVRAVANDDLLSQAATWSRY